MKPSGLLGLSAPHDSNSRKPVAVGSLVTQENQLPHSQWTRRRGDTLLVCKILPHCSGACDPRLRHVEEVSPPSS
eukprot:2883952-Amphidinium_carterae.2